jgi:hypothetical protein
MLKLTTDFLFYFTKIQWTYYINRQAAETTVYEALKLPLKKNEIPLHRILLALRSTTKTSLPTNGPINHTTLSL